jgi:hypothetical protein
MWRASIRPAAHGAVTSGHNRVSGPVAARRHGVACAPGICLGSARRRRRPRRHSSSALPVPETSGFETRGSQIVLERPGEAVYLTATAREIGDDALDDVIHERSGGRRGARRFAPDELRGASDLRPLVANLESCEVDVPGRHPVHGGGLDSRHAVGTRSGSAVAAAAGGHRRATPKMGHIPHCPAWARLRGSPRQLPACFRGLAIRRIVVTRTPPNAPALERKGPHEHHAG